MQMVGTQRSGSNLLRMMLDAHDGISAPPSVHMLRVFRDLADGYGTLNRPANRRQIIDDVRRLIELNVFTWRTGPPAADDIDGRWTGTGISGLFQAVHDAAAEGQGANAWVCKSLENVHHLSELYEVIPGLVVLHLVRDGRDVALSFRHLPVGPKHPYVAAQEWMADQRAALAMVDATSPPRFLQVRYESLTTAPEAVLPAVCAALGTHFDARALNFHASSEAQGAPRRSPLWRNLDRPVLAGNTGKFADPDHRPFVELFEATAFDLLVALGYEPLYVTRVRGGRVRRSRSRAADRGSGSGRSGRRGPAPAAGGVRPTAA
jgi:hypothetical protein